MGLGKRGSQEEGTVQIESATGRQQNRRIAVIIENPPSASKKLAGMTPGGTVTITGVRIERPARSRCATLKMVRSGNLPMYATPTQLMDRVPR